MIRYVEANERRLEFRLETGYPKLTGVAGVVIEQHWQAAKMNNPKIFNGQVYSCHAVDDDGEAVTMGVNQTDYKTYKWARDGRRELPGAYGMGNCMFVFDPLRDAYVFAQRSREVAFDKGKISGVGGVLDYKKVDMAYFERFVRDETLREAGEELVIDGGLQAVALLGLYWEVGTLKTEFAYYGEAKVLGVKGGENKAIVEVRKDELTDFVAGHIAQLEESTKNHLTHIGGRLAGKK